jgi:3-oxoacyl-[acyl-carrier-protein] synthase-3
MLTSSLFKFPEYQQRQLESHCRIIGAGAYYPSRIVTNQEIIATYGLEMADIAVQKTLGIKQRRAADPGLVDSDLLAAACEDCLRNTGIASEQLSRLIVTKFVGDNVLPMTAAMVQRKLGSGMAFQAFDLEGGVNAFLQAFDLASRYVATDGGYVLIASGGIMYDLVSKQNLRTAFLFGDAAAAVLVGPSAANHILASYFYTNYAYYGAAMANGAPENRDGGLDLDALYDNYQLDNWKNSVDFYLQAARVTAENLLRESGLSMEAIDWVFVTENNKQIRDLTLETLGVKPEQSLSVIDQCGNTMSAMLPLLIDKAYREGLLKAGEHVMLISHGEGACGGGMIYKV